MPSNETADTGYAPVNGLEMYYEIHGDTTSETPILLLHGAFHSTGHWGQLLPGLAATRQVIAPDFQAPVGPRTSSSMGDFAGIGKALLAIQPGTCHYMPYGQGVLDRHQ